MKTKFDEKRLNSIYQKILQFNHDRKWDPSAPDLAKSVVIEAAELLELFQWQSTYQDWDKFTQDKKEKLMHEVADVIWYLFLFCDKTNIDIVDALETKYQHNSVKYPAEIIKQQKDDQFYFQQKAKYRESKK